MNTLTLPTTLHCAGCIQSIKPFFDKAEKIKEWKVDLSKPVKTITVSGENIQQEEVIKLLREAGYDTLEETTQPSADLPPIGHPISKNDSPFWNDTEKWKRASFNTANCLIGCSMGDFGMIVYVQAAHPHINMFTQMFLATIAGLCTSIMLETTILRIREKFEWKNAFTTALSMSMISMVTMEIAMNLTDFMITGGKASFNSPQYWIAFAIASVAGFLAPLPYNYYKLKKYNQACH